MQDRLLNYDGSIDYFLPDYYARNMRDYVPYSLYVSTESGMYLYYDIGYIQYNSLVAYYCNENNSTYLARHIRISPSETYIDWLGYDINNKSFYSSGSYNVENTDKDGNRMIVNDISFITNNLMLSNSDEEVRFLNIKSFPSTCLHVKPFDFPDVSEK